MKSSIISSSQPRSVAVGDLNNDQHMDIVVANAGSDTIGIFVFTSNATLVNEKTYSTGYESHPSSIALGHFNDDNYLDIAVANYATNNIAIFLGNGDGIFVNHGSFSTGSSHPLFVTVAHLNNDDQTDLVVVNYGTNTVGILLGFGNGSFQDQTTYFTGYDSIPYSLAVGHFNKDNYSDIAVVNYGTNNVGILLGYDNGTFTSQKTYTTLSNSNPSSIVLGDFNDDNRLDIAVSNNGSGNVGIFLGHGNGSFQSQIIYPLDSNSHPEYITVADLNNDNELDIVITDSINGRLQVLRGYGNGSFATITTYDIIYESGSMPIAVADFNNNNQSDIIVANYGANNVLVLMDYRIEPSTRQVNYHIGSRGITTVAVTDVNNDQIPDMISSLSQKIFIVNGLKNGTFDGGSISSINIPVVGSQYICVGDIYNDNVGVLLGRGNGTFIPMTTYSTGKGSSPMWVTLGDMNNDGRLDIVCANKHSDNIAILFGNGDGTFTTMITYYTGNNSSPNSVAVGDVNRDNCLDIVVVGSNGDIVVFLGHDDGTLTLVMRYSTYNDISSIVLGDFNGDNNLDIAFTRTFNSIVAVFRGYGNGTFVLQTRA